MLYTPFLSICFFYGAGDEKNYDHTNRHLLLVGAVGHACCTANLPNMRSGTGAHTTSIMPTRNQSTVS